MVYNTVLIIYVVGLKRVLQICAQTGLETTVIFPFATLSAPNPSECL